MKNNPLGKRKNELSSEIQSMLSLYVAAQRTDADEKSLNSYSNSISKEMTIKDKAIVEEELEALWGKYSELGDILSEVDNDEDERWKTYFDYQPKIIFLQRILDPESIDPDDEYRIFEA